MVYVVTSEYDEEVNFLKAHCPSHAIERGRDFGMVGTLNAVEVKDKHHLHNILLHSIKEIAGVTEQVAFLKRLSSTTRKLRIGGQFCSMEVTDLTIAGWKFTCFPYSRADGTSHLVFRVL